MEGGYPRQTFLLRGMLLKQPIRKLIKLDMSRFLGNSNLWQKQVLSQLTLVLMVSSAFNSIFYFHLLFRSSAVKKCVCDIQINIIVLCIRKLDFYLQGQCKGKVKPWSSLRLHRIFLALSFTDNMRPSSSKNR